MEVSPRAQDSGPALIRLLARLGGTGAPPPTQPLSARLSAWIDWRHAVALSAALDARPAPSAADDRPRATDEAGAEWARVQAVLGRAIDGSPLFATTGTDAAPVDAALVRKHYLALQQVMEAEVAHLRGRLRNRLAGMSAPLGRVAAVDAVLERALAPRERTLLAPVPELVARHFEHLREAAPDAADDASPQPWLARFRGDLRQLLLAELDLRLRPAQGLLATLRSSCPGPHAP